MKQLNNKELLEIQGGANFYSAAFINAFSRGISTILDLGRSLGSAIRRMLNGSMCPL